MCAWLGPIALDCEMVGDYNNRSLLARVSIVDKDCRVLMDTIVHPVEPVKNYRTFKTGLTASDLGNGASFRRTQDAVIDMLERAQFIIGHSLHHDFAALKIDMEEFSRKIVDIRNFPEFKKLGRELCGGHWVSLKVLSKHLLGETIQNGVHCSIEDAAACMKLYRRFIKRN